MAMTQTQHTTIQVRLKERHQTLCGFGASGAWWAQVIGGWRAEQRQRVIDLLFNPTRGIGLTLFRYNVGGGEQGMPDPWRNSESVAQAAGYDWTRDANARRVLREAHATGARDVVIFANSPPGHMTVSGRASGNPGGGSNLRPDMRDVFARHLVDVARHLIEHDGVPVRWISPINEPQWDWQPSKGQEGCHYTADEIIDTLRALQRAITQSGLDLAISAIEAGEWKSADTYARPIFAQPELASALTHFAVHSYWSSAEEKRAFAQAMRQRHPGVPVWMSEWTEMKEGRDYGMDSALVLANTVHDDLTIGGVVSWQYWIAVSKYDFRDGLLYTDGVSEHIEETKRLWTLGNYSRFVRPGAVRIGADSSNPLVRVSAYLDPASGAITLVAINNSAQPQRMTITATDITLGEASMHATSDAHNLAAVSHGVAAGTQMLAGNSVTTLVFAAPASR